MPDFEHQSNIFGEAVQTSNLPPTEPASQAKTLAGKLIDHLKYVADSNILLAQNKADWLAIAADAGQNIGDSSLVRKPLVAPDNINGASILAGWVLPALPTLPTLPAIPDGLNVDIDKIKATWEPDLTALKGSWMAQLIPALTDMSSLDRISARLLDGTYESTADSRLTALSSTLAAAILAITTSTQGQIQGLAAAMQSAITAAIATQSGNIAGATAIAINNTQEIAWARARDQAAREGRRIEDEATSDFASKGFALPAGVLLNQIAAARQATQNAASTAAAEQATRIQAFLLDVAKITVDSWQRTMDLQARMSLEQFQAIANTNLKFAELQLDGNKANAEFAVKQLGLSLDFTKNAADIATRYRVGIIEGVDNLIGAYAKLRADEADYVRAISAGKAQVLGAIVEYYRAQVANAEIGLRVQIANTENQLRYVTSAGEFIGTAVRNHVSAASASADAFARIAASAISGLNAVASQSSSG